MLGSLKAMCCLHIISILWSGVSHLTPELQLRKHSLYMRKMLFLGIFLGNFLEYHMALAFRLPDIVHSA